MTPCDWHKRIYTSLCPKSWVIIFLTFIKPNTAQMTGDPPPVGRVQGSNNFYHSVHSFESSVSQISMKCFKPKMETLPPTLLLIRKHYWLVIGRRLLESFSFFFVPLDREMGRAERRGHFSRQNLNTVRPAAAGLHECDLLSDVVWVVADHFSTTDSVTVRWFLTNMKRTADLVLKNIRIYLS